MNKNFWFDTSINDKIQHHGNIGIRCVNLKFSGDNLKFKDKLYLTTSKRISHRVRYFPCFNTDFIFHDNKIIGLKCYSILKDSIFCGRGVCIEIFKNVISKTQEFIMELTIFSSRTSRNHYTTDIMKFKNLDEIKNSSEELYKQMSIIWSKNE